MLFKLSTVNLTSEDDRFVWKLEPSGKFTNRSIYRFIAFPCVIDVKMMEVWNSQSPLKVQISVWMAWHEDSDDTTTEEEEPTWIKCL